MTWAADTQRLAVLVHEVRSPVAALSAIAETFARDGLDAPARVDLARLAIAACRGIERVVRDVAVASIRLERVDAGALVHEAAAAAALSGAKVEVTVAPGLPLIAGDPLRLRQALDNLVVNGLTYTGSHGGVTLTASRRGARVLLSVSDSGDGVASVDQERIFEAGVRLDSNSSGSGLGLAIARAIAEAHGGTLTVASTPGEGATFTITLPVH